MSDDSVTWRGAWMGLMDVHWLDKKFWCALMSFLRRFARGIKTTSSAYGDLSLAQARMLNRFAGTSEDSDLPEDSGCEIEDDFDVGSEAGPIVAQVQNSKSVLRGGEASNGRPHSRSTALSRSARRSKRSEEIYKRTHMIFDGEVRIRVMDVDRFELDELHHYFMYTLVRRFPAEKCVKLASRIALFRDKQTQHSFESMSKDVAAIFGPIHGPELTALFSRCSSTIPVAFMLDYTRRFGKFSRKFIAMQVEKSFNPRLFDFVRYPSGVRPLPGIVTRPFALRSFAWLLPPCSAKRYLFQHLLAHTGDPAVLEKLKHQEIETSRNILKRVTSGKEIDPSVSSAAKGGEKLVSSWKRVERPSQLIAVESSVYSRQPVSADEIIEALESESHISTNNDVDAFILQRTQVQSFKSPLDADSDELASIESGKELDLEECPYENSDDSWWRDRQRSASFFRYNKKSYRLGEEGWKQIEDPRGELPDYDRAKALRRGRTKIRSNFARQARKKQRNAITHTVLRRLANS